VRRTAHVIALWQSYGFCHGVLNTDNLSILGLTIDFGPFGWMDYFNKDHICNHSDDQGRYSFKNQPEIGKWNLMRLAEGMQSHLPLEKTTNYINSEYDKAFKQSYYGKMREKLGLYFVESEQDMQLIDDLFNVMHANTADFTNTFVTLAKVSIPKDLSELAVSQNIINEFSALSGDENNASGSFFDLFASEHNPVESQDKTDIKEQWRNWLSKYKTRLYLETFAVVNREDSEEKNFGGLIKERVSSFEELQTKRAKRMSRTNPLYVLRNYMADEAIKKAEKEDFSGVNNLLKLLLNPFEQQEDIEESVRYKKPPPKSVPEVLVSCSS